MRLIIVGGGKLGYYLAATMLDRDHEVKLIEKDERRCLMIANSLDEATGMLKKMVKPGDTVLFENDLPDNYTE